MRKIKRDNRKNAHTTTIIEGVGHEKSINAPVIIALAALAITLWVNGKPDVVCSVRPVEVRLEGLEKMCSIYQDWGYANGLAMTQRILGEQSMLESMGLSHDDKTCEQVAEEMYDLAQKYPRP